MLDRMTRATTRITTKTATTIPITVPVSIAVALRVSRDVSIGLYEPKVSVSIGLYEPEVSVTRSLFKIELVIKGSFGRYRHRHTALDLTDCRFGNTQWKQQVTRNAKGDVTKEPC